MSRLATLLFLLPLLACGILAHPALWPLGLALLAALVLWRGWPGKYPSLLLALLAWSLPIWMLGQMLSQVLPAWLAYLLTGTASALPIWLAARLCLGWGQARAARLTANGHGIRESEWVFTGARFALTHPWARSLGWLWLIVAFVAAQAVLITSLILPNLAQLLSLPLGWLLLLLLLTLALLPWLTLMALIFRHPIASPLVWLHLILSLPVSAPLMLLWADSPRANLIFRHRFQRLRP